ncbi:PDF receptor [Spodoptera frugiperda]|uniref:PDF receptor n=1 Tax=Spodoptera frugiperda TaxID=7108 RepID=A0A9R0E6J6_SPOFR|nr:PDF receptor [Spodoptera frugiperda]
MQAYRRCGAEGLWVGRHYNDSSPNGWTNYTPCFPEAVQYLLSKVGDKSEAQLKFETAVNTRTVEMIGIVLSIIGILMSLYIFSAFPSLHNRRTLIHRNLFCALLLETTIRMLLYTQQAQAYMLDKRTIVENARKGIENLPYVCEGVYVLLEYARLSVYAWMFIEGVFLNTMISANTLRNEINVIYFYFGGWVIPTFIVAIWATLTARHYAAEKFNTCWFGYNYLPAYYIINGPIVGILIVNTIFLVTVLAVIITKLRRTNDSELEKVKKAIRATLILLPLLGIINIFNLFEYPLEGSSTGFAIWAYVTHFFRSFQGLFISSIYCFTNEEVLKALRKRWDQSECVIRWRQQHQRQHSDRTRHIITISDIPRGDDIPMTVRPWDRPSSTNNVNLSECEAGPSHFEEQHTATVHVPTDTRLPCQKDLLSSLESGINAPMPPRRCSCESAPSRYHIYHRRSLEAHEAYTKVNRRCSCDIPCRRYSTPYDRPRESSVRAMSCVPSTHTIPRMRRGFTRPGLVTRESRMGHMSISSCL